MARNKVQKANDGDSQREKKTETEREKRVGGRKRETVGRKRAAEKNNTAAKEEGQKTREWPLPFLGGRVGRFDEA